VVGSSGSHRSGSEDVDLSEDVDFSDAVLVDEGDGAASVAAVEPAESAGVPDASPGEDVDDPDAGVPESGRRVRALVARRSDFAHPLPLKWIVGGANARATGPPHSGHRRGPASLIPRKTSNRWPQDPHT
jgi:hypothetical protein